MADSFLTVAGQVLVLFVLIGLGMLLGRLRMLNQDVVKSIADLALVIVSPCVIIQSFMRKFDSSMMKELGVAALAALVVQAGAIFIARVFYRGGRDARRSVLRFAVIFSNAGYMAIPLQQALLGDIGVFYGAAYIAVFNLFLWSYGLWEMSDGSHSESGLQSAKKMIINPGTIGLFIGLLIFLLSIPIPEVFATPIHELAAMNTPLPMLIIGFYLSQTDLRAALKDKSSYAAILLRLVLIPLLTLAGLYLCGMRGPLLVSCVVASSAPVAAATTMFATKYNRDTDLSVNLVSLSTLFSMITMPIIVGIARNVG